MRIQAVVGQLALGVVLISIVTGCAFKHRDEILFGTQTQLAIDLSESTATKSPEFSVGYKRVEFVSLPLFVNGIDSKLCDTASDCETAVGAGHAMYTASGIYKSGPNGKPVAEKDAYSVFGSFGAKFGGGSTGTGGALAQYFATGIAAQNLAQNPRVYRALAVPPGTGSQQDMQKANSALRSALGQTKLAANGQIGQANYAALQARVAAIVAWTETNGKLDSKKWTTCVKKLNGTPKAGYAQYLQKYSTASEVTNGLMVKNPATVPLLFSACKP